MLVTLGPQSECLAAQAFCLASARKGRATGSDLLRRGYFDQCERAGVCLCKGKR